MDCDKVVRRSMRMLDRRSPGWLDKIDEDRLNIAQCNNCIMGQLDGEYTHDGVNRLVGFWRALACWCLLSSPQYHYGFIRYGYWDYVHLTTAWKKAIRARRKSVKIQSRRDKRGHRRPQHLLANAV